MILGIFKIALRLRDWRVFMWQPLAILNAFSTLTFNKIFFRPQTFVKKLEYDFLLESSKNENATFPYKTARSVANVRTNRLGSNKEGSFASNYFIFLKTLFQFKNLV